MEREIDQWLTYTREQKVLADKLEKDLINSFGLSEKAFYVLLFLDENEHKKMRLNLLQEKVGLSQSAMSRLISRMEDKHCGVIERSICLDDKRGIYLKLTDYGKEKLEKAKPVVITHIKESSFFTVQDS